MPSFFLEKGEVPTYTQPPHYYKFSALHADTRETNWHVWSINLRYLNYYKTLL
jgi:hypothetical protein